VCFKIDPRDSQKIDSILEKGKPRMMVCPGSKWINKQLPVSTLTEVLALIGQTLGSIFYLVWGNDEERFYCQQIQDKLGKSCIIVEKLSIPVWQNLMRAMDLVIAVDSSALHLCGTTATRSFSLFGPTDSEIFKPVGTNHFAIQGACPYGKAYVKQCPILRTCSTGACLRDMEADKIYNQFIYWWKKETSPVA